MNSCELFSLSELFERVVPYTPSLLVPKDNLERILKFVDLLPQTLPISGFGFETLLNTSSYRTDLSLCINLLESDSERLKDHLKSEAWSAAFQQSDLWQEFSTFVESAFFTDRELEYLWLEFEIGDQQMWPPLPNLLLKRASHLSSAAFISNLDFLKNRKILKKIEMIFSCAEAHRLSPHFIGWNLGRSFAKIGVEFPKVNESSLAIFEQFLCAIGYLYPVQPLLELIGKIAPALANSILMQVEVGEEGVGPLIAIECVNWADYQFLLSRFATEQLITQEEVAALNSWVGGKRYIFNDQTHEFHRLFYQLKIFFHPEKPLQTKAYFAGFWRSKRD